MSGRPGWMERPCSTPCCPAGGCTSGTETLRRAPPATLTEKASTCQCNASIASMGVPGLQPLVLLRHGDFSAPQQAHFPFIQAGGREGIGVSFLPDG
ncbi:hypothetical protein LIER_31967 [Lithospermum erythrorhizon]|uniref:Uncharacterized protein n=1 Tax=Lithospermum erythrorhizon TaxID=34254 RepID=A0AAV3RUR5_LITER